MKNLRKKKKKKSIIIINEYVYIYIYILILVSKSSLFEMSFKNNVYRYLYKNKEVFIFIIQIYYNVKNYKSFFTLNNICKQNNTKNKFIFKYFFSFFFFYCYYYF